MSGGAESGGAAPGAQDDAGRRSGGGPGGVATGIAHPRAALLGNPSDLYGGRTIAFTFADFAAEVEVRAGGEELVLEGPAPGGVSRHESLEHLERDVDAHGYGPECPLLEATVKRFATLAREHGVPVPGPLHLRAATTIPRQVGLGGSSAIVVAALRALCTLCAVDIARERLPGLALSVETEELDIVAGLQDRVAQVYGGLVYMDLGPDLLARDGHGRYQRIDPTDLPPLYVAYRTDGGAPSTDFHSALRRRHDDGDGEVGRVMDEIASLAARGRHCIARCEHRALGRLVDRNFDLRRGLAELDPRDARLVEIARSAGATANFAGSGGAVVGTYGDAEMLAELERAFAAEDCRVLLPGIT